jgi:GNAT superfamily N-acetyltransferase
MNTGIRPFKIEDSETVHQLFPEDWGFHFSSFIKIYNKQNYFKAISLVDYEKVIGFGNIFLFGRIGWLGNIVVAEDYRNKGFGTRITVALMEIGKKSGVTTFNLIATELGEFVYKKLDFEKELLYEFYDPPENRITFNTSDLIKDLNIGHLDLITDVDFLSTGEKRGELLKNFLQFSKGIINRKNELEGFYLKEFGNGLIVSKDKASGIELMKLMINDRKMIVIADKNIPAKEFLLTAGYNLKKSAPRMIFGEKYKWEPENIFSRASGYLG